MSLLLLEVLDVSATDLLTSPLGRGVHLLGGTQDSLKLLKALDFLVLAILSD